MYIVFLELFWYRPKNFFLGGKKEEYFFLVSTKNFIEDYKKLNFYFL